jgi:hypothetical protein
MEKPIRLRPPQEGKSLTLQTNRPHNLTNRQTIKNRRKRHRQFRRRNVKAIRNPIIPSRDRY